VTESSAYESKVTMSAAVEREVKEGKVKKYTFFYLQIYLRTYYDDFEMKASRVEYNRKIVTGII